MSVIVYQMKQIKKLLTRRKFIAHVSKAFFWFTTGAVFATFLFTSFTFIIFEKINKGVVYPGITINDIDVGKYTPKEVEGLFIKKNEAIEKTQFTFSLEDNAATISAKDLKFGYDQNLIAKQAISLGRSDIFLSNISIVSQAYFYGLSLQPAYHYSEDALNKILIPFTETVNKEPVDALFNFQNGKVLVFKPSEEGKAIDIEKVKEDLKAQFEKVLFKKKPTDKANNLGIKELIGTGTSLFQHSIQSRIFNINLAAERINGVLIAPNEEFSFDKALV